MYVDVCTEGTNTRSCEDKRNLYLHPPVYCSQKAGLKLPTWRVSSFSNSEFPLSCVRIHISLVTACGQLWERSGLIRVGEKSASLRPPSPGNNKRSRAVLVLHRICMLTKYVNAVVASIATGTLCLLTVPQYLQLSSQERWEELGCTHGTDRSVEKYSTAPSPIPV